MLIVFPTSMLLFISIVTNVTVEGIKKLLNGKNVQYSSNVLAIVVSIIVAAISCGIYVIINDITFTAKVAVEAFILMYCSFLVATVGYDKVTQMIGQIKLIK